MDKAMDIRLICKIVILKNPADFESTLIWYSTLASAEG
jgi:hypothetical protein